MRLRLWQRLFIAFATLSVLALAGLALWQQHAFRSGFLGYLDEVALDRLQPASTRLSSAYAEHGNWDFLRDRPDRFGELIDDRHDTPRIGEPGRDSRPPPPDERPPPDEPRGDDRLPKPHPPPHPPHGPPDLMPRLVLLDAGGAHIVGNADVAPDAPAVAIELDGRRIGTLRLARQPALSDAIDVAFAHGQLGNVLVAAIAVLAGALLLAFAFARGLLKPVHALATGTRALMAGDYRHRIAIERNDELGDLAGDFNHLAATLEQHRDARRRWGADIAHELRTPLSVLRGEIQALQDGVRTPTPLALDSLHAECERLGGLIEQLYQLSLADAGALEYRFETLDLGALVAGVIDAQRGACTDAGLTLDSEIGANLMIRGDSERIAQLVGNLLANARRYTDAPGRIHVDATSTRDGARIIVEDTAPGVPAASMPRLFERLYRVEGSRSRESGGAGLGLAICRAIVEAHGGRIDASPSVLGGLRIAIDLPKGAGA